VVINRRSRSGLATLAQVQASIAGAEVATEPFRHWLLCDVLPRPTIDEIVGLPFPAAEIGETLGKRETHNSLRVFFAGEAIAGHPACNDVARAFQHPATVAALAARCGASLAGTFLRIEYCQDLDGFWLEPHTDIGAKRFTLLIGLSDGIEASGWGTDLYSADLRTRRTLPWRFAHGVAFVPASDTWHGFHRRPIRGVRRSLIINYVGPEWRSRHELAFPDAPVRIGSEDGAPGTPKGAP
jgi:hypothetical protein